MNRQIRRLDMRIRRQRGWRLFASLRLPYVLSSAVAVALAAAATYVIIPALSFHVPHWVLPAEVARAGLVAAFSYRRISSEGASPDPGHGRGDH